MKKIILQSTLTCPACNYAKSETMSTDSCSWFYECENCKLILKPKKGDCCVYCSYGSIPCPPVQELESYGRNCC